MVADPYETLRAGTFSLLILKIGRGHHIPEAELAEALVKNRGKAIPDEVLDYLVATLRGKIKKPRGRKPKGAKGAIREALACSYYEKYLLWLQKRQARSGLQGWSCIQGADWWQGPPHERAAAMTARWFRGSKWNVSARHIQNLVSSLK